jgi:hypothetical protein
VEQANQDTDPSLGDSETVGLSDAQIAEKKLLADHADVIEEMRGKYDEIAIFKAPKGFEGIVIVATPANPKTFQNYVNNLGSDKTDKAVETVNFAVQCTVFPRERTDVKAMYTKRGAFALKVAGRAQELCGSETKELGKD